MLLLQDGLTLFQVFDKSDGEVEESADERAEDERIGTRCGSRGAEGKHDCLM